METVNNWEQTTMQKNVYAKTRAVIHFLGHKSSWSFHFPKVKQTVETRSQLQEREGEILEVVVLDICVGDEWF